MPSMNPPNKNPKQNIITTKTAGFVVEHPNKTGVFEKIMTEENKKQQSNDDTREKIRSLQEMIATAEKTITSAKQILSHIESKEGIRTDRKSPTEDFDPANSGNQIIHGTFDGKIMVGEDGRQYPVPANYASKSKLIEGDMLKLTITPGGNFVYKQIGPVDRKYLIGIAQKDERGNLIIATEDGKFQILLAAGTYFKIEEGDEVTIVIPKEEKSIWAAVENVTRKAVEIESQFETPIGHAVQDARPSAVERLQREMEEERRRSADSDSILDEWTPDIEQIKKEAGRKVRVEAE